MIEPHKQAVGAFRSLYGRDPVAGRDDLWDAFKNGWNTSSQYLIGESERIKSLRTGPENRPLRCMFKELVMAAVSAKARPINPEQDALVAFMRANQPKEPKA